MFRKFLSCLVFCLCGLFAWLLPQKVEATELYFKLVPNTVANDKTTIIEARIDPQAKLLNVVEGTISFQGTASDKLTVAVETGGSVLTLWPIRPKYSADTKTIRFTGGVPKGFNADGLLFRLRLSSGLSGNVTAWWSDNKTYLNDGQGTKEIAAAKSIAVSLNEQASTDVDKTSPDKIAPIFDMTDIGQDPSVHEGKYFISLHANDDASGVARYEVKEGDILTTVTDGVYVFKDQSRRTPIVVTAYDQAGNSQEIKIKARYDWRKNAIIISLAIIVLLVVVVYVYKKKIKK